MQKFSVEYKVNKGRLFTDCSKRSITAVLLHNGNNCLLATQYTINKGMEILNCGDLKVLCMLLRQ
jgi:hypothetical protein